MPPRLLPRPQACRRSPLVHRSRSPSTVAPPPASGRRPPTRLWMRCVGCVLHRLRSMPDCIWAMVCGRGFVADAGDGDCSSPLSPEAVAKLCCDDEEADENQHFGSPESVLGPLQLSRACSSDGGAGVGHRALPRTLPATGLGCGHPWRQRGVGRLKRVPVHPRVHIWAWAQTPCPRRDITVRCGARAAGNRQARSSVVLSRSCKPVEAAHVKSQHVYQRRASVGQHTVRSSGGSLMPFNHQRENNIGLWS